MPWTGTHHQPAPFALPSPAAAAIVVAIMLLTGCMSPEQARRAIRWDVYLMIAGSFGVSAGLEQSGGAAAIANLIVTIGKSAGGGNFTIAAV